MHFFVYGTLKEGGRFDLAYNLRSIRKATERASIKGLLLDLGSFPGIVDGDGVVHGELHEYGSEHAEEVLRTIDFIEGYRGQENESTNLYNRKLVEVKDSSGRYVEAYVYYWNSFYNEEQIIRSGVWG